MLKFKKYRRNIMGYRRADGIVDILIDKLAINATQP